MIVQVQAYCGFKQFQALLQEDAKFDEIEGIYKI